MGSHRVGHEYSDLAGAVWYLLQKNTMHTLKKKKKRLGSLSGLALSLTLLQGFTAFLALLKLRQEREVKGRWVCGEATHESSLLSDPGVPCCLLVWISIIVSVEVEDNPSTCLHFSSSISPLLPLLTCKDTEVNQLPRGFMILGEVWNWSIHCKVSWHSKEQEMMGNHRLRLSEDFPGGPVVKNPPPNAGGTDPTPELGRFHLLRGS